MSISKEEVKKVAHLAKLYVEEQELTLYKDKLNTVIDLVNHLNEFDTENIEPLSHPHQGKGQRLRKDEVTENDERDYIQQTTSHSFESFTEAGLYLVPTVIETNIIE